MYRSTFSPYLLCINLFVFLNLMVSINQLIHGQETERTCFSSWNCSLIIRAFNCDCLLLHQGYDQFGNLWLRLACPISSGVVDSFRLKHTLTPGRPAFAVGSGTRSSRPFFRVHSFGAHKAGLGYTREPTGKGRSGSPGGSAVPSSFFAGEVYRAYLVTEETPLHDQWYLLIIVKLNLNT